MERLWESNAEYAELKPQSLNNMPYKRLYGRLTPEQLSQLLHDAEQFEWKVLDLSDAQIDALPDSIGRLTNLQALDLSKTRISALPDSIGNLTNLQTLDLRGAQINALPDSIGNLTSLQTLDLSDCRLQSIPYGVVTLGLPFIIDDRTARRGVNLTGATLDEGDLTLFAQPREVIEAYYREQAPQSVNECKVIFLGDGAAGKSSLIERIVNNRFQWASLSTEGVKMTKWRTELNGAPFTLRFLDFGGQEIMHSMHRCFLTAHTVYVVVCESRDDWEIDSAAARWLETVRAFASDCPVILALNKCDLNPNVSVNERELKQRNPALKCVLKTSAAVEPDSRYGVRRLLEAIMEEVPACANRITADADTLAVMRALEDMTENYISSEEYREICERHHITDEKQQFVLLGWFRDLGVAYYYESESFDTRLESVRVLNPEWLTNGIYRLILRTPEGGFLRHEKIRETLRATHPADICPEITYSPQETEFILHVMRKFEISREIRPGMEMIPLKMTKTPPHSVDSFPMENALHLRWEGTYLPVNLIHRLLIRKFYELDTDCVWRTGGRFHLEGSGNEALAMMSNSALDVYVSGERDCRPYMETFRVIIQDSLSELNLNASEILCVTVDGREGYIPYKEVMRQYHDRREEIYIPGLDAYVSPAVLLRETYFDWQKETERWHDDTIYVTVSDDGKTAANPSEGKRERPKAQRMSDESELVRTEIKKNRAEARKIMAQALCYIAFAALAVVAAFSVLALLITGRITSESIPQFLGKLFGILP